jgi:hypothetical protein
VRELLDMRTSVEGDGPPGRGRRELALRRYFATAVDP